MDKIYKAQHDTIKYLEKEIQKLKEIIKSLEKNLIDAVGE